MEKFYQLINKSFGDLKVKTHKDLWNKLRKSGTTGLKVAIVTEIKKDGDDQNSFNFVFSSAKEDRHGDIVEQNFDLKFFKKNPVLLDSHDHRTIESIIGKVKKIGVAENKLKGSIEFALDNPKGELARKLVDKGFINTTSIGFRPLEFDSNGTILKSELLEVSMVSVPAQPEAGREKKYEHDDEDAKNEENNGEGASEGNDDSEDGGEKNKSEDIINKRDADGQSFVYQKEFEKWDETNEFVRCKVRDIAEFDMNTLRKSMLRNEAPRISAMMGNLAGAGSRTVQMLFFFKEDGWTLDDAKKWFIGWQSEIASPTKSDIKQNALNKINKAIKFVSEEIKVETRPEDVRAENNRLVNKAIRNLIKIKEK